MRPFDDEDRELITELYNLNDEELKQAEKVYHRSSMSACACGRLIADKRKGNGNADTS